MLIVDSEYFNPVKLKKLRAEANFASALFHEMKLEKIRIDYLLTFPMTGLSAACGLGIITISSLPVS